MQSRSWGKAQLLGNPAKIGILNQMLETFFIYSQDIPSNSVRGEYSLYLVLLSYLIATLASYTGLTLANRIYLAKNKSLRSILHIGAAFALGGGIWSMHFIGMLAYNMKIPVHFNLEYTFLSIVIAIVSAYAALSVAKSNILKWRHVVISAILLGAAICLMHYVGMAAMRMEASIRYEPTLFMASLCVAISASALALGLIFYFGRHRTPYIFYLRVFAALILGLGICGMHFVGMAAANFLPFGAVCRVTDLAVTPAINHEMLALVVTLIAGFVVILALTVGIYNQEQRALTNLHRNDVFPIRLIMISVCLTFFVILTLGGFSAGIAHQMQTQNNKDEEIHGLVLDYLTVDKKLSNALALFAMTREKKWGDLYLSRAFEQQRVLSQIKEAVRDNTQSQFSNFDLSEESRSRFDRQILALAGSGAREPAILLLQSREYQSVKAEYEEELEEIVEKAVAPIREKIKQSIENDYIILFFSLLSAITLSIFWYFALRSVRGWQKQLIENRNDLRVRYQEKEALENRLNNYIDEVKRARDRALRAMHEADHANKAKTDFLTNMSHELRTPMNSILGLTELLLKNDKTIPEHKELLAVILEAGETLLKIVNDVLDIAKIEAEGFVLQRKPFVLQSMLNNVINTVKPMANEKHLKLEQEFDAENITINEDEVRLSRIFTNLLGNAVKYTDHGSVKFTGHVLRQVDGSFILRGEILDTGIGIAPDKLDVIFEKFSQADNSITRKYGGTGLGLSITKELVELMSGEIGVESVVGKGSQFWIEIPVEVNPFPYDERAKSRPLRVKSFELEGRLALNDARILVAEDHPLNQVFMQTLFDEIGFRHVRLANNGREVLDILASEPIDLVLMDCQMPEMNGFESTRRIRAQEAGTGGHLPIIAMTARAMVGDRESCLAAGMDDYISKPVDLQTLQKILSRWIVMESFDS